MKILMRLAAVILLNTFIDLGYGQLPVNDVVENYKSIVYNGLKADDQHEYFSKTIVEITFAPLSEIKYQTDQHLFVFYLSRAKDEQIYNYRLLYPNEQIKRENIKISHYMALGKGEPDEEFIIITFVWDKRDEMKRYELSGVKSGNEVVITGFHLIEIKDTF